jgi:hypothetical protein
MEPVAADPATTTNKRPADESAEPRKHALVVAAIAKAATIEGATVDPAESTQERDERRSRELVSFYDRCNVDQESRVDATHGRAAHLEMQLHASEARRAAILTEVGQLRDVVRLMGESFETNADGRRRAEAELAIARTECDEANVALFNMQIERDTIARALIAACGNIDHEERESECLVEHAIEAMGDALAAGIGPITTARLVKNIGDAEKAHAEFAGRREAMVIATAALAGAEHVPK